MNTKITISIKIITLSAILLISINIFQSFFVSSALMKIIRESKESQFDERVNVIFQTLEQEESTLQDTIESLSQNNGVGLENRLMEGDNLGENSIQSLKIKYRPEFQVNALNALESVYYSKSDNEITPFILDRAGFTVMHPDIGRNSSRLKDMDYIKDIIHMRNGSFNYQENGTDKWIVFRTYADWGWTVCYTMTLEEKFLAVSQFNTMFLIILGSSTIVFLFLVFISLKKLLLPLSTVESKITEISTGEGDLTKEILVKTNDEVAQLAGSFNTFIIQLKQIVKNIKNASFQTLKIRDELAANTEETASALVQISSNVSNMRSHISKLDENILSSSNSIHEIDDNISSLNTQMHEQSSMVRQTSASVTEMIASINNVSDIAKIKSESADKLLKTSAEGGDQLKRTSAIFKKEIGDNVDKIGEMVTIISGIASKTNLLSMNAAIESAHAGDAGLGFAVVADEIRKLADESSRQVKEIKESIKFIIQGIDKTDESISSTDRVFTLIHLETKEVVDALSEIFSNTRELSIGGRQIQEAMSVLNDISINISSSSDQMEKGSALVNQSMNDVQRISNEVSNGMGEIVSGTDEVNQAMGEISGLTLQLGTSSDQLGDEINRFKTE